jgi:hypothetical protein
VPLCKFSHNSLNVLAQIANEMGLQKKTVSKIEGAEVFIELLGTVEAN